MCRACHATPSSRRCTPAAVALRQIAEHSGAARGYSVPPELPIAATIAPKSGSPRRAAVQSTITWCAMSAGTPIARAGSGPRRSRIRRRRQRAQHSSRSQARGPRPRALCGDHIESGAGFCGRSGSPTLPIVRHQGQTTPGVVAASSTLGCADGHGRVFGERCGRNGANCRSWQNASWGLKK